MSLRVQIILWKLGVLLKLKESHIKPLFALVTTIRKERREGGDYSYMRIGPTISEIKSYLLRKLVLHKSSAGKGRPHVWNEYRSNQCGYRKHIYRVIPAMNDTL